ncbi:MAG: hypothetical protein KKF89_04775 [Nanoarchaeota archaeon]|nr:hypothetical protein [Nanoarchaeota archaeon]MBU1855008.1 hypothetical protein [Nanoarchaeota archaeon]
MSLTTKEIKNIKKALDESARPIFFFDDDPDGVCSFVQFYKYKGDGKGVILKTGHQLTEELIRKVDEYQPDLVVILDIANVHQEFLDKINQKVIWIDHHPVVERKKVEYYNPRLHDENDNRAVSYWTYQIVKKSLWTGMVGCVADWQITDLKDEFIKQYPDFMDKKIKKPDDALFETKTGLLARIISFSIKGSAREAMKIVKILTRIRDPREITDQTTPQGAFVYKRFQKFYDEYKKILENVKVTKSKLLLFTYNDNNTAVTSELSNELLHKHPDKFIIIGRERNEEVKMSLRSATKKVHPILKKALEQVEGYGGGHDYACGACVKKKDFKKFIEIIKKELKK